MGSNPHLASPDNTNSSTWKHNIKLQNVGDNSLTPLLCLSALFSHITQRVGSHNDHLHFTRRKELLQDTLSPVSVADESAPPEDTEKVANYILQINLPLTSRELTVMLDKIRSIMKPCEKYKMNASKRKRKWEEAQTLLVEAQEAEWVGYSRTDVTSWAGVAQCMAGLLHTPGRSIGGKAQMAADFSLAFPQGLSSRDEPRPLGLQELTCCKAAAPTSLWLLCLLSQRGES